MTEITRPRRPFASRSRSSASASTTLRAEIAQVDRRQPRGGRRRHHVHARGRARAARGRARASARPCSCARWPRRSSLTFSRIQFTPDLMPADILGTTVIDETQAGGKAFEFRKGPVFANIVLADEMNRATPKTQSALLEAMQEHRVTRRQADARARRAVLRPRDAEPARDGGDLPAARGAARPLLLQAARRLSRAATSSTEILDRTTGAASPKPARGARPRRASSQMQQLVRAGPGRAARAGLRGARAPGDAPRRRRTRPTSRSASSATAARRAARRRCSSPPRSARSSTGASPPASTTCASAAHPALRHRVLLNFEGEAEGIKTDQVIDAILKTVPESKPEKRRAAPGRTDGAWVCSTSSPGVAAEGRVRAGRRPLRRRVPAQARVPRARQPARVRRAPARRAAHEEERQRRRVRRPPRLPAGRRLPLPRLERLPALRAAARPPLRGGGGPRHLLHPRHERVDGLRRRATSSATRRRSSRGARVRGPREPRPREHRHDERPRDGAHAGDARQGAHLQGFRFLREVEGRRARPTSATR